jgi:hypothetical protein
MLGGAHRPRPVNYLALACRYIKEAMRIADRLRPYMAEQARLAAQMAREQELKAALDKVYGPLYQPHTSKR